MMPGRTLHRLATRICSAKTLDRVVEPAIADLQKEYAVATGASRRAQVLLAGYLAILRVIVMCTVNVSGTTTDERGAITRTITWSLALILAVTGLLMLPPLLIIEARASSLFLVGLIPQAVPLAIPIGLTFGIAFGFAGRTATRATVKVVVLIAVAASLVSLVTLVWVMPAANQAYRESAARAIGHSGQLMKGRSEMTLSELNREVAIAAAARNPSRADGYAWSFHLRFALSAAPVVLAAFLFAAAGSGAALRGLLAFAACFVYWALIYIGETGARRGYLPPLVGAWLPNVALIATAMLIACSRSSRLRGSLNHAQ